MKPQFDQTQRVPTFYRDRCWWVALVALIAFASGAKADSISDSNVISYWSFDNDASGVAIDQAQEIEDAIAGPVEYVPGVSGRAIKFDGFRSCIKRNRGLDFPEGSFTVESWVALASYPWSWAPVVDCSAKRIQGFFFGIGRDGSLKFQVAAGNAWQQVTTVDRLPLRKWSHIAAVFEPDERIAIFINGKQVATTKIRGNFVEPIRSRDTISLGRTNYSQTWSEYQLTTEDTYFYLDGILDEVKISATAKDEQTLQRKIASIQKMPEPELSDRSKFPRGSSGNGTFGAFYTKLDYYREWDALWRVGDKPDIYVRFDRSDAQLVFWRGCSFVPCWVTENDIWYTNEWLETWGRDVVSCAEPIMDRDCRYSHVRLIENTDARVVVHWRYALNDAFYKFAAISDDKRGEWCDEYHIIYPDQVGVRRMELHYSEPKRKHDWVEQIVVLPPGKYPDDVIEKSAITLANMKGETKQYSWHDPELKIEMPEPKAANISVVELKSEYRPFIIVSPSPVDTVEGKWDSPFFRTFSSKIAKGYKSEPVPTVYGWWNHWPVAQVPGDGRWVTTADRPSHFNLTTFVQWEDYKVTPRTRTRIMLQGVTNKSADELVPLAESWLKAPLLELKTDAFSGGAYDQSERAYIIESLRPLQQSSCDLVIKATSESPIVNPAIIIKNWGSGSASVLLNGKLLKSGEGFRQGVRKNPEGDDLIVWLPVKSEQPVKIEISR